MPNSELPPVLDLRILYVEDDELTRKGIVEFLSLRVKEVLWAADGRDGLEKYRAFHPDILITDIRMPVMNGLDLIREIKTINKDMPVIVTTAYNDIELLIESIDLGINQYILKPIVGQKLLKSIQKCLRSLSLEKELVEIAGLLSEYKNAIDASGIVMKFDTRYQITYVNDAFCNVSGFTRDQVIEKSYEIMRCQEPAQIDLDTAMKTTIRTKNIWKGVIKNKTADGLNYYLHITVVPITTLGETITEFMSIGYEVTELIKKEEELLKQLYFDRATDLPNRGRLLTDVEKSRHPLLILINVDNFQQINDFYGNETGDYVIVEIASRIARVLPRDAANLYKMPADEYAILMDDDIPEKDLIALIKKISEEINDKPFVYKENNIHITVAAGVAWGREDKNEAGMGKWRQLALNADMALKKAKKQQKHYVIYDESMQITKEYENNIKWTRKLKEAIKEDRIVPFFQPILNNTTRVIEKYECLVRMVDNDGSVYSPFLFLDLSKKTKLYHYLTRMMIRKSMDVFKNTSYEFSINLSVDDILDEETHDYMMTLIRQNPETSKRMVFEILESEGIENYEEVKNFIKQVKEYGCKVAIDDFGTGYSNFSHILKLNVDYLKIDASLTKMVHQDRNIQVVTETIVEFSKKLNIRTIAEFVHSREVYEKIIEIGVDYSQGYYFGEPRPDIV